LDFAQQENCIDDINFNIGEVVPSDSDAIAGVLQQMTNRSEPIHEEEIVEAAGLLQRIINSPYPAKEVFKHLDEFDGLLLALLELNIQQAHADGHPDLARALQNLVDNIYLQIGISRGSENLAVGNAYLEHTPSDYNIHFLCQNNGELTARMRLAAEALSSMGCGIRGFSEYSVESVFDNVIVYVSRPHVDSKMLVALIDYKDKGIPIILDLEADLEQMPIEHRDYEYLGLSTLEKAREYKKALSLADQICVNSNYLASTLRNSGYCVKVIPDGWSNKNALWDKPPLPRDTLNLGWIGISGQLEDLTPIRRIITRIIREFPHVRLVISGDHEVYQLFDSIPESRRLYLPVVSYEHYPYLFNQIDVLINPLRNIAYNCSLSDRWLMEAGIKRIPWVSSPLPAVVEWGAGGVVAKTQDEWHFHLRRLIIDECLRDELGSLGRHKAEKREMNKLIGLWYRMILDMRQEK
jgi:hypothetical protein